MAIRFLQGQAITGTLSVSSTTTLAAATVSAPSTSDDSIRIPSTAWVKDQNYITSGSLPTVNNNTITFTAGTGLTGGGAITLNQSFNETITFNNSITNNNQLTNGAGYTTNTGTTTASNTQTFTNKSGNISQWTNNSGYITAGSLPTVNNATITLSAGTGLSGGGVITLNQASNETVTFNNTITNNNQLTNGAGYTTNTGTTTAGNTQTFTNKSGNISQWTNDAGYTTSVGDITGVTAGSGMSGGGTSGTVTLTNADKGSSQNIFKNVASDSGTAVADNNNDTLTIVGAGSVTTAVSGDTLTITGTDDNENYYVSGASYSSGTLTLTRNGLSTLTATGFPTNNNQLSNGAGYITSASLPTVNNGTLTMTTSTGLDGGTQTFTANQSNNTTFAVSLDLSELTDMTAAMNTNDEFIVLDSSAERRKRAGEIGLSIFSNDSGFTTNTGTTTASNSQTFTNKSGNISQWTNNSGYITAGSLPTVNNATITLTAGTGLSGGGTITLNQASNETVTFNNSITNNNQLTNGAGYTTNTGTVTSVALSASGDALQITGTPVTGSGTLAINFQGDTEDYINGEGDIVAFPSIPQGDITAVVAGTGLSGGGTSGSVTLNNTITNNNQLTNGAGYTTNVGDITGVTAGSGMSGGGSSGSVTLTNSDKGSSQNIYKNFAVSGQSTIVADSNNDTLTLVASGGMTITTNASTDTITFNPNDDNDNYYVTSGSYSSGTLTLNRQGLSAITVTGFPTNNNQLTNGAGYITSASLPTVSNATITFTAGTGLTGGGAVTLNQSSNETVTFNNSITNNNQLTNGAGYTTNTGTTTASNSQTFTNKGGNISQWTNDSGYTTASGTMSSWILKEGNGTETSTVTNGETVTFAQGSGIQTELTSTSSGGTLTISNTITNNNQLTNGAGYTTNTGTTTASNSQTFTNKGGNISQWTNNSGYVTSSGVTSVGLSSGGDALQITNTPITGSGTIAISFQGDTTDYINGEGDITAFPSIPQGDITAVNAGTGMSGGGTSGSVTLNCDITNNNQLTNGAGYTTNVGDITGVTAGTGMSGGGTSGTVTLNCDIAAANNATITIAGGDGLLVNSGASGNFTTNQSSNETLTINMDYGGADNFILASAAAVGTAIQTTDKIIYSDVGDSDIYYGNVSDLPFTNNSGDITNVTAGTGMSGGGTSGSVTLNCTITNNNQLTNGAGYTTNTGTTTASNSQTFTNKGGNISQWTNNSGYITSGSLPTVNNATITLTAGTGLTGGGTITLNQASNETVTFNNSITNNNQLTNGAGYTTNSGTVTGSGATNRIPYWSSATGLSSNANLSFNPTSGALICGGLYELVVSGDYFEMNNASEDLYTRITGFGGDGQLTIGEGVVFTTGANFYVPSGQGISVGTSATASNTIRSTGNIIAYYSDERLKDFEGNIPNALDKVCQLGGYYYKQNEVAAELGYENYERQVGVNAQEVYKVMPEVVEIAPISYNEEANGVEYLTVDYAKLVPLLIESIKELKAEVDALKAK